MLWRFRQPNNKFRPDHELMGWQLTGRSIAQGNNAGNNDELASFHPGGVNVLMGDGSVRFLKDSVNLITLRGLVTRQAAKLSLPTSIDRESPMLRAAMQRAKAISPLTKRSRFQLWPEVKPTGMTSGLFLRSTIVSSSFLEERVTRHEPGCFAVVHCHLPARID